MATTWRPDTCECVLQYDGIDEQGEYINPVLIKHCEKHKALGDLGLAAFHRCKDDNQFKNQSIAALEELGHSPEEIGFEYDNDFKLTLKLPSRVAAAGKIAAQNHIKSKFTKAKADRLKVE